MQTVATVAGHTQPATALSGGPLGRASQPSAGLQSLYVVLANAQVPGAGAQQAVRHGNLHQAVVLLFPHNSDFADHRVTRRGLNCRIQRESLLAPVRRPGWVRSCGQQHLRHQRACYEAYSMILLQSRRHSTPFGSVVMGLV